MKQIGSAIITLPRDSRTPTGTPHGGHGLATPASSLPSPTPRWTQSLSPQAIQDHRATIAFEVELILAGYWQTYPPPQIKAGIIADWCDALQDWTLEQCVWALRRWRNANPDRRPNPGHILASMVDARARKIYASIPKPEQPPEPPRIRVTAERVAAICAEIYGAQP